MISLVFAVVPLALFFPGIAVLLNMDPLCYILDDIFSPPQKYLVAKFSIRLVMLQYITLELGRSFVLVFLPTIATFNLTISFLKTIQNLVPNKSTIKLYIELRCLLQMGSCGLRNQSGFFMLLGFVLGVLSTWVVVMGLKYFPLWFYFITFGFAMTTYLIILQTLPIICQCVRLSNKILKVVWPTEALAYWESKFKGYKNFRSYAYIEWKKQLRAQPTVAFYYLSAAFDGNTTMNFFANILDNSINLVLIT